MGEALRFEVVVDVSDDFYAAIALDVPAQMPPVGSGQNAPAQRACCLAILPARSGGRLILPRTSKRRK